MPHLKRKQGEKEKGGPIKDPISLKPIKLETVTR